MRIIAGLARGRHLKTLQGLATRPTADRVRESLFNILGQNLDDATFMDLYAGSGAVGIEALSRGASSCAFVDSAPEACRIIHQNLETLGLLSKAEIHCREVIGAIEIAARKARSFDYVFCDPPYGRGLAVRSVQRLGETSLVSTGGLCIVEHSKREELPASAGSLRLVRNQAYGDTVLSFYGHSTDKHGEETSR